MHALQWLGKKNVGVKEMPRPMLTDAVRCVVWCTVDAAALMMLAWVEGLRQCTLVGVLLRYSSLCPFPACPPP